MANVTSEAVLPASLDLTIGAEFIGLTVALLLYGASTGQLFWYFRKSEGLNVTGWMVYYIVMLWSLGTLQVILTSYLLATYLVLGRGNLVAVFGSVKVYAVSVMVSDFTSSMVRYGYLYRIWKFTHKRFLICLALCTVLTTLTLGVSLYFGVVLVRSDFLWQVSFRDLTWSYFVAFGAQVIVDLMIAFVVFSSFLKFCTGIQRFDMLIRTIMIFVLSTGALAVAFTTGGIIVFVALPRTYVFNGMFWTYCQLHICSFLAVLNTEKELARRTLTHRLARATVQLTTRVDVGSFADTPPPSIGGEAAYGGLRSEFSALRA
ncbi:uncharacterized protein BXZ73DRAFT_105918 [Epithele typhae]|uniref:uncharacterized protein n=1 Tax=Epithele typhae TaxID=378194 RepID=UPI0020080391|nr:uncharacterized protein BXZ73DRAFT_105918 [Epithele typhae]KAH9916291.1 hypothetical protein BXZ73DRAFT_105918 [Epithele typhae]